MAIELENLISEFENWQKAGLAEKVQKELKKLKIKSFTTDESIRLANLAWRCGCPEVGLKILKPVIFPEALNAKHPTDHQYLEYCICLQALGGFDESNSILNKIQDPVLVKKYLYMAFNNIYQWDYIQAAPLLEKYLTLVNEDTYDWWVGNINLISCYVFIHFLENPSGIQYKFNTIQQSNIQQINLNSQEFKFEKSQILKKLLANLEKKILATTFNKLTANFFEIKAQLYANLRDWSQALLALENSHDRLTKEGITEILYHTKWSLIIETNKTLQLLNEPNQVHSEVDKIFALNKNWLELKEKALTVHNIETLRDCDLYISIINLDLNLFLKVFHGTRHLLYKEKLKKMLPSDFELKKSFILNPTNIGSASTDNSTTNILDLELAYYNDIFLLSLDSKEFSFLSFLVTELYLPTPVATVFYNIYPDEFFDFEIANKKIHQLLYRLRKIFKTHNVPLDIIAENNTFLLIAQKPILIKTLEKKFYISKIATIVDRVSKKLERDYFSSQEFQSILDVSDRQARRLLNSALEEHLILKEKLNGKIVFKLRH